MRDSSFFAHFLFNMTLCVVFQLRHLCLQQLHQETIEDALNQNTEFDGLKKTHDPYQRTDELALVQKTGMVAMKTCPLPIRSSSPFPTWCRWSSSRHSLRSTVVQWTGRGRANRKEIIPTCAYMNAFRLPAYLACFLAKPSFERQSVLLNAHWPVSTCSAFLSIWSLSDPMQRMRASSRTLKFQLPLWVYPRSCRRRPATPQWVPPQSQRQPPPCNSAVMNSQLYSHSTLLAFFLLFHPCTCKAQGL